MRLALTSDLHGQLPDIPPCDALLIAGDVCPISNHDPHFQADWLRRQFVPWLSNTPARQRIFIAGNHDFVFASEPALLSGIDWPGVYLQDSGTVWEGVQFWGSPWANELPGWPFTAPERDLQYRWDFIPDDTNVLLVHGPAHGVGDVVIGSQSGDELHVGSRTLDRTLDRLKDLRLVVFGHIHEGAGWYRREGVPMLNASMMDVHYYPVHPVRTFDLDL
jgi:Icc-related predicted phosphoesterase